MKNTALILLGLAALSLSGCQTVADHDAKTRADLEAGRAAAEQGRLIAAQALEAVKGVRPSNPQR